MKNLHLLRCFNFSYHYDVLHYAVMIEKSYASHMKFFSDLEILSPSELSQTISSMELAPSQGDIIKNPRAFRGLIERIRALDSMQSAFFGQPA